MNEEINFVGEHLFVGNLGQLSVILATFAALFSSVFYFLNHKNKDEQYFKTGRVLFYVHCISVLGIIVSLFAIIFNHYYEYQYAWQHSDNDLPVYYMISCFWEGQEGSFLLWMFWHSVIGLVLTRKAGKWEPTVMSIVGLAQFALGSMLLGLEVGGIKIGSSPFVLLREFQPDILNIPVLASIGKENYLQTITNGNGLNQLLQNYWMVIHPPTLFFGFATAIVPFAYALAGLMKNEKTEWLLPALSWTLVSTMVLGAGIIMGGYWAYESLNFGGYWAWDPVENASLMPWVLLIAAAHILLISKYRQKLYVLGRMLVFFAFFLVLYATFLTRSGVLGEASVHSFTDLGLSGQLLLFLFLFVFIAILFSFKTRKGKLLFTGSFLVMLVINVISTHIAIRIIDVVYFGVAVYLLISNLYKINPGHSNEEKANAREFWMFLGALVLMLSGIHIVFGTSSPVLNKLFIQDLFDKKLSVPGPEEFNSIQIFFAMGIALLSGMGQFFRYRTTPVKKVRKELLISFGFASVFSTMAIVGFKIYDPIYLVFLFLAMYCVVGNFYYLSDRFKSLSGTGASIAHIGFGVMMIGVLVSSVKQQVISYNNIDQDFVEAKDEATREFNRDNILLVKNKPTRLGNYVVTFVDTTFKAPDTYFHINYKRLNEKGDTVESFELSPRASNNPKMGVVANPDTRHYWNRDIFTHVNYESGMEKEEEFKGYKTDTVQLHQNFVTLSGTKMLHLDSIVTLKSENENEYLIKAFVKVEVLENTYYMEPAFTVTDLQGSPLINYRDDVENNAGVMLRLTSLLPGANPSESRFVIESAERKPKMDYVVMKAIVFPFIRLVWAGTIIMVLGFAIAIRNRNKQIRNTH
jgi:cytochrome c-type biogenesis protein CcmF